MRRFLIGLSAFVIATGSVGIGQSGVRCYYDWSTARFNNTDITDSREFRNIVSACSSDRAESVPWDEYIRQARAVAALPNFPSLQDSYRRFIQMLERERDHLSEVRASGAPDPSAERREVERAKAFVLERLKPLDRSPVPAPPAPPDGGARPLPGLPTGVRDPTRPPADPGAERALSVAPAVAAWLPPYLRDRITRDFSYRATLQFSGDAWVQRGDERRRLSEAPEWIELRPDDTFVTGADGRITLGFPDGTRWEIGSNTQIRVGTRNCLVGGDAMSEKDVGTTVFELGGIRVTRAGIPQPHVLYGSLVYASTGLTPEPVCANGVRAPAGVAAPRGTRFSTNYDFGTATARIVVYEGRVEFLDLSGTVASMNAGTSRQFSHPVGKPLPADHPVAAAVSSGVSTRAGDRWFVPAGAAGVWLNARDWAVTPQQSEKLPNVRTFVGRGVFAGLQGSVTALPVTLRRSALEAFAREQARRGGRTVVGERWITVNDLQVLDVLSRRHTIQADAGSSEVSEYFSGPHGTCYLRIVSPHDANDWPLVYPSSLLDVTESLIAVSVDQDGIRYVGASAR